MGNVNIFPGQNFVLYNYVVNVARPILGEWHYHLCSLNGLVHSIHMYVGDCKLFLCNYPYIKHSSTTLTMIYICTYVCMYICTVAI